MTERLTSAASAGAVTFTNVNDAPVISSNALTIAEGATVVLGSGNHQYHRPRQHARSIDLHGERRDQRPV
jgi:hypothetical protein